ncbi:protein hinderin [Mantella aurantiaca]
MDPMPGCTQHTDQQGARGEAGSRSASLKDLCPEDKRRIANLIKELARVSEEKEVTEERLKSEQESFEKKIRHLEDQNKLIATEREDILQQYRECQEMLSLYQKYLSDQQDKLSRSLCDPGAVHPPQVPKTQRKPTVSELNGSYLPPCHKQNNEPESSCSTVARLFPVSGCGGHCRPDRFPLDSCARRNCCSADMADVRYPDVKRGHCGGALDPALCHCCPHWPAHSRHPEDRSFSSHSAASGLSNGVAARLKGSAMTEQRKHELMLQKVELEVEKERLQELLDQHEAKLLKKEQELLQTKLESQRSPLVIQTREAAITTTPSLGALPKNTGSLCSPVRPSSVGLPTPPSSKNSKKLRSPNGTNSGKKGGELISSKLAEPPQISVCKESRRDQTTSPEVPSLRTEMNEVIGQQRSAEHRDILRYETSLIDMLDAISPIPSQRQRRPHTDLYDLSILSPPTRRYSKPARKPVQPTRREPPPVDPEERRILEEIFFIC